MTVDNYDTKQTEEALQASSRIILNLDRKIDYMLRDDLINLKSPDAEALEVLVGDYVSARIVRALAEAFYVTFQTQRQEAIQVQFKMKWN